MPLFARTARSLRHRPGTPLDCREVGRVLQAYLDGEADPVLGPDLVAHLEVCRHCGLDAEVYRRITSGLHHVGSSLADPVAVDRLRAFGASLVAGGGDPPARS